MRPSVAAAVIAVALSLPSIASAQVTGFAINRHEPAERGSQFFVADGLDLRGNLRPAIGATLDYSHKPLAVYDLQGTERGALIRHSVTTHLGASFVFLDSLRLGLNLPIAQYQEGENQTSGTQTFRAGDKAAIGDIRLAADLRLVGRHTDPFTLAIGVRAWLPTGQRAQFTGDGSGRVGPHASIAGDLGLLTYAARLGVVYRARDDVYGDATLGSEVIGNLGAGIKTKDGKLVVGPEIYGSSVFTDSAFAKRTSPAEWLFGLHYGTDLRVAAGVGGGLTRGLGAPQLRALVALEYVAPHETPDRDKDTIPDDVDACPDEAGVSDPDPKKNGCPPPPALPADADGDGVPDNEDACPKDRGIRTGDTLTNGCPDKDGDGIPDHKDMCPDVSGIRTDDPKTNGCPPDRDGDSVYDFEDACPDVKGARTTVPTTNGCPPDTDGDGILNDVDACPNDPGPKNEDPKKNGCPLVVVTDKAIRITEQVKFKTGSADLLKESDGILEAVRAVLAAHPEIGKLRIEGHTDNVGNPVYNKELSAKRAASVMTWLTGKGIPAARLVSAGYGLEQPIDSNDTEEGRANNRRVAFTILEKSDAPPAPGATPAPGTTPAPKPTPTPGTTAPAPGTTPAPKPTPAPAPAPKP